MPTDAVYRIYVGAVFAAVLIPSMLYLPDQAYGPLIKAVALLIGAYLFMGWLHADNSMT